MMATPSGNSSRLAGVKAKITATSQKIGCTRTGTRARVKFRS